MNELQDCFSKVEEIEMHFRKTNNKSVVLLAKLSNSEWYKQNNFTRYLYKLKIHNDVVIKIAQKYNVNLFEYSNNTIMCEFNCNKKNISHLAINAAIEIVEIFDEYNRNIEDDFYKIQTEIGIAYGTIVYFNEYPQGQVIELAKRIQSHAKPNQILISQSLKDSCDISKITSKIGKALNYVSGDYFGFPVCLKTKDFLKKYTILELRALESFKGIKKENSYEEYWKNYRFEAYLSNIDSDANYTSFIKNNYYRVVYDLRYETILNKDILKFVCTTTAEQFNSSMRDTSLFSRYNLPINNEIINNISNLFVAEFVEVDGIKLIETNEEFPQTNSYYYCQWFTHPSLKNKIGTQVNIRYRISTIINKFSHFFYMTTEYPIQKLSMVFKSGNTDINRMWLVTHFSSESIPKIIYTPSQENAKEIEVTIENNEWIYPGNGVTFIWKLNSEGYSNTVEETIPQNSTEKITQKIYNQILIGGDSKVDYQKIDSISGNGNQINYKSTDTTLNYNDCQSQNNDFSKYIKQLEALVEGDNNLQIQIDVLKKELENGKPHPERKLFWEGVFSFGKHAAEIIAIISKIFET